jgi:hypothetical protein
LLFFLFFLICVAIGGSLGAKSAFGMAPGWRIGGMILGAVLGGAAAIAAVFVFLLPFEIYAAIRRALEPADLLCRCHDPNITAPAHLAPSTALEAEAVTESRRWADWPPIAGLRSDRPPATDALRAQLNSGSLTQERLLPAADLGEPAAAALAAQPINPDAGTLQQRKLPADLRQVLNAGLPPRLCMAWAMTCAARALAVFENEFHQDTRPRQRFGLALMALRGDDNPEIYTRLAALREKGWYLGKPNERGCRVLHRSLAERIRGRRSRGEYASDAVLRFASAVADYVEPATLWRVYSPGDMANAYLTSRNRCEWSLPSHGAEAVAVDAIRAAEAPAEELARQRTELARLILNWKTWDEDREAWRVRIEEKWIPKVKAAAAGLPFEVPAYIEQIRETHVPWMKREAVG